MLSGTFSETAESASVKTIQTMQATESYDYESDSDLEDEEDPSNEMKLQATSTDDASLPKGKQKVCSSVSQSKM